MYTDRLGKYFTANNITDATRKRAILNSVVGSQTYKRITDFLAPKKPNEATYPELVDRLEKHFKPAKSSIIARFQFNSRYRRSGESIAEYLAALRALASDCTYGQNLDEMLRDRLVCGVRDERIQKSLLAQPEDKLDLKRSVELAQSMQLAGDQAKMLTASSSAIAESSNIVNTFKKKQAQRPNKLNQWQKSARSRPTQQPRTPCGNCGTFHKRRECPDIASLATNVTTRITTLITAEAAAVSTQSTPTHTRRRTTLSQKSKNYFTFEL